MRKKFIKRVSMGLAAFVALAANAYAVNVKMYDECVSVSGTIKSAVEGEKVTVSVLKQDESFDNIPNSGEINIASEFYSETEIDDNNSYNLLFSLNKAGRYTVYIGSKGAQEPEKTSFVYMSTQAYCDFMKNADKNALAEYIKSNKAVLGIDENLITDDKVQGLADILFDELKLPIETDSADDETKTQFVVTIEKAVAIEALNNGDFSDLDSFLSLYELGERELKYFNNEYSNEILKNLSEKNIKSLDDLDEKVRDAIILSVVNNGSESKIGLLFDDYSDIFTNTNKTGLSTAAAKAAPFKTVDEIKTFISNYKESSTDKKGGGSSGGGGSSKPILPGAFDSKTSDDDNSDTKQTYVFGDIEDLPWATDAITQLYYKGVINGKEENLFFPNDLVAREEFAKMISLAFEMKLIDNEFPFTDIASDDWCYSFVKTAYLAGITNGIEENVFGKGQNISRQDLCVMVYRAVKAGDYSLGGEAEIQFADSAEISDYAQEAVSQMSKAGIVSGDENRNFNPLNPATRAEAAKIIYLATQKIK